MTALGHRSGVSRFPLSESGLLRYICSIMSEAPGITAEELRHPYLAALNEAQRAAVQALDGPVLVLAGAGTGKTRVLTARLSHLLITGRATPGQVLAVTFTNKAAREMKDRVAKLLGRPVEGWWLGTFHALAARMLRERSGRRARCWPPSSAGRTGRSPPTRSRRGRPAISPAAARSRSTRPTRNGCAP
jgi:hypothetical protein